MRLKRLRYGTRHSGSAGAATVKVMHRQFVSGSDVQPDSARAPPDRVHDASAGVERLPPALAGSAALAA